MKRTRRNRRGATILELGIVLLAFVVLTFGMLDLGLGVFRYHILANAARQGARRAIVHGALASNGLGSWGTGTINVVATDTAVPIVGGTTDGIQPMLVGCNLSQTWVNVQWIDGGNAQGNRVRVTVTSPYTPFMTLYLKPVTLSAASTMQIAH
jgi:Flp pilus assembly protein TadG